MKASKCFSFTDNFSNDKSIPRGLKYYLPEYTCIHLKSDHHLLSGADKNLYKKKKSIYYSLFNNEFIYLSIRDRTRHNPSFVFIHTIHVFLVDIPQIFILFYFRY